MSTDYSKLNAFALATTKMHLANQYALSVLTHKVKSLEERIASLETKGAPELEKIRREFDAILEHSLAEVNGRTEWASPSFPDCLPSPLSVVAPRIEPG